MTPGCAGYHRLVIAFYSSRLGCLGSLLLSVLLTVIVIVLLTLF
jgi:hypothetical protein